ncbi:MAG TPA: hypothetical protein VHZ26_18630 [Caulobacteraceae bacterium]|jgi:hypothetical protein|nr:hypothetical protein [Caulobacteraceae bacterium]
MSDQRLNPTTRLLLAASIFAGLAAAAHADPYAPAGAAQYSRASYNVPRSAHHLVATPPRVEHVAVTPDGSDVVPVHHDADDQPQVELGPGTAHLDHAPDGLDDDPTTFGLVAKF